MPKSARTTVFVSYSHKDRAWLDRILQWLKPLEEEGLLDIWDDSQIQPGAKWKDVITRQLATARAALLLVTQDFLSSRFIKEDELPPLLAAAEKDGLRILWIAVKPSTYKSTKINDYQAVNDPSKPLSGLKSAARDEALLAIYDAIRSQVKG
jgi:hypothetical protein